jgi:hypothetical protein
MGFSAKVPNSSTTIGVVEAFDILPGDLNVTPLSTFSSKGRFGGPFAPSSQSYTLTNTGTSSLDWTASVDQTWLSVTPPSGTLAAGASTTVNVMLTPVASGLGGGSYTGATTFKNLTDGTLIRIQAVLTVAPPSTNADLASLAPKLDVINPTSIKLVPGFSSGTTDYGGRVSYTATSVTVTPTVADGGATVTVNGVPVGSGTPSKPIALTTGINHITTVVTAEDRVTTKTYRIAMTRPPSTDFYLSSLVPDVGSLSPPFENARFSYSNFVSFNTTSIRFTPTPSDGAATVTVNGAPATSGTASGPINLNPGANLITVAVTAADGVTTGTYTVTVIRPLPDTTAPMVALRKPPTATTIVGPAGGSIPTSGTASDNSVVASVQVSLNGGAFTNAMVTPGAKLTDPVAWSFSVKPENGPNNLMVRSMDAQGNKSATKAVNFRYLVLRPEFAGKYAGPAAPTGVSTNPARHVGISAITVTKTGQFTGSLKLGGSPAAIPLRATFGNGGDARFGADGASTVAINRPNLPSILLALHLDVLGGSQRITGTLTENGKGISDLTLDRLLYAALTNPVPSTLTGAYTGIFQALTPPNDTLAATDYPQGHGYALASVQTSGRVTVTGKLADGQAFSYANYLSQAKVVPLYLLPYAGTGTVSGLVKFQDLAGSDADGAGLRWFKPDNLPNFAYPKGWPNGIHVDFLGSKFLLPARRTPAHPSPPYVLGEDNILGLPAPSPVMLALIDGGITSTASIFKAATVDGKNKATITPPVDPLLNLKAAFPTDITTHVPTGKLSGSFTHPVSKKTVPFSGVVFQKLHTADGYFLGPPAADAPAGSLQSGAVTISPP